LPSVYDAGRACVIDFCDNPSCINRSIHFIEGGVMIW